MKIRSQRLSRLRQKLDKMKNQPGRLLPIFLKGDRMIKGSVYLLRNKCGKSSCRCARGHRHETMVLSASVAGRTRLRTIPQERVEELRLLTQNYRCFRSARADFVKLYAEMLRVIDGIEKILRREP